MTQTFTALSTVIILAAGIGMVARLLKQPTLLAYLATGIIAAATGIITVDSRSTLETMSTLGVALLLFLVGLQMRLGSVKAVGRAALLTGLGQIAFTASIGFLLVKALGFATLPATYIAVALTFSSTIVIIKLLTEKRDLQSLYGRIVVGFLLVQDFVAILMLVLLAGFQQDGESVQLLPFAFTILKSAALFGVILWLSSRFFPWLFEKLARTPELLFITSIAWALGLSLFVSSSFIGLSVEIGGFLAGLALAKSVEQYQIEAQLRPLRDFFIVIFFVVLGSTLAIDDFSAILGVGIILALFVLIGNPLIVLAIMGALGYRRKTSFSASVTVAQISEFSLIVMAMGLSLGHVTSQDVSLVTFVGIVTFLISTYMVLYSNHLYAALAPALKIFERAVPTEEPLPKEHGRAPIVVAGAHRLGSMLVSQLPQQKLSLVDFDPEVVAKLRAQGYRAVYGDITDVDIQEHVGLDQAYVLVSTIPSLDDNLLLLEKLAELKAERKHVPVAIMTAYTTWEAKALYAAGAEYVIQPHILGGKHLASLLRTGRLNLPMLRNWRQHDRKNLEAEK